MATEKFHYTSAAGKKFALKRFKYLPVRVMYTVKDLEGQDAMFVMLRAALSEKDFERLLDDLTMDDLKDLMQTWQSDAGITVGESAAS